MSSYFSSLLTTTTSRVASIRQNLLQNESDGDSEYETHIARVLRNYYTEKGRPFPRELNLLPPGEAQPIYAQTNVGAGYGGFQNSSGGGGGATELSSLWAPPPQQQQDPQGGQPQNQSLRQGRAAASLRGRQNPFTKQQAPEPQVQARPLPSQSSYSSQNTSANPYSRNDTPPGSSQGLRSAKDRLKQGVGLRPQNRSDVPGSIGAGSRGNSYGSTTKSNGSYEDSFAPGVYNRGVGGGGDKPFVAATAPWASNEAEFTGGGYSGYDAGRRPAPGSKGPGLPSGPRGRR
ncbi:uncharacterized protein BP5553_07182 [Venustampulla echinocandica]|uniref:Mso1 N-terminal domain-containing protein n=1 Tax=Venustampulla echinocandica TaxID=2656787 RepID=A0A370TIR6_9HELO|nr:uncharacterized protein BP5553_07182 [Venustampulla echinocandica]RDL35251.1 hypothetical protein BP5553_07182 [Venustampulla echinocandica]